MTTDRTKNVVMVKIRAQDLADAALVLHWSDDKDYPTHRYDEAETKLLGAIFADWIALVSRIEDTMMGIHDAEVDFRDYATAIACDLIGKDLDEALRERRKAEDAA